MSIVMANISMEDGDLEIRITDVQEIDHVPDIVKSVIKENTRGRKLSPNGLPEVLYLGADGVQIKSAFQYGELGFMEVEGDINVFKEDSGVVCITAYKPDQTYEELKEGKQQYIEELKEKYPNGVKVEDAE